MKSYLAPEGLSSLQGAVSSLDITPNRSLTGFQLGTRSNFVPDSTMNKAQGGIVLNKTNRSDVKLTFIHMHEMVITAVIDRSLEIASTGNLLFFIENQPMLWLVADNSFGKVGLDPIAHIAGDKCYMSVVFRFPYIRKILYFDLNNQLHAKWPIFNKLSDLVVPQHILADQALIQNNNLVYGGSKPVIANRVNGHWLSSPLIKSIAKDAYRVDGGTSLAGI